MVERRPGTGQGVEQNLRRTFRPSSVGRRMRPVSVGLIRQDLGSMA